MKSDDRGPQKIMQRILIQREGNTTFDQGNKMIRDMIQKKV